MQIKNNIIISYPVFSACLPWYWKSLFFVSFLCLYGSTETPLALHCMSVEWWNQFSNWACPEISSSCLSQSLSLTPPPVLSFRSVELQKANLEGSTGTSTQGSNNSSSTTSANPLASAIPLAQLLAKPGALNALSSLSALGGLTELLAAAPVQTTGVHRPHRGPARTRSPPPISSSDQPSKSKSERTKFNPYWVVLSLRRC